MGEKLANKGTDSMPPKPLNRDAFERFQAHFDPLLNPAHELVQLARKIDWGRFEAAFAGGGIRRTWERRRRPRG